MATTARVLWWLVTGVRRPAATPVSGERAERLRLGIQRCRAGADVAAVGLRTSLALAFLVRAAGPVHRLGRCSEYALAQSGMGVLCAALRLRRRGKRVFRRLFTIAAELGDPQLNASIIWVHEFARMLGGESTAAKWAKVTETQRQWIEVDRYLNIVLFHCFDLVCRGYASASLDCRERALTRASGADAETLIGTTRLEQMGRALLGQPVDIPPIPDDRTEPGTAMQYVMGSIHAAVEQDEVGEPFEAATEAFDRLGIPLREFSIGFRIYFAYQALGRLSQARHAAPEQRAAALTRAEAAVRQLGRAANDPWLKAYHRVLRADLWQQRGRHDRALTLLGRTEERLLRLDAPLVRYEAARIGARALRALGE